MANHRDTPYKDRFGRRTDTLFYDQDLEKNIELLHRFIAKVKPQDHYARGWEDSRVILLDTVEIVENLLKKAFTFSRGSVNINPNKQEDTI